MNYSISFNGTSIIVRKNKIFICTGTLMFNNLYNITTTFKETKQVKNTLINL